MVANAGIVVMKPLMDSEFRMPKMLRKFLTLPASVEEYDSLMGVNSRGLMMCFKYAALQMVKQGGDGCIIGNYHFLREKFSALIA